MYNAQARRNTPTRPITIHKTQAIKRWVGAVMKETIALSLLLVVQVSLLMVVGAIL
ncbi:MAG TPA: hypothetical protein VIC53_08880 [Wenzhouxiangella sp.]